MEGLATFFGLISYFIALWSMKIICIISLFQNLLRHPLGSKY